MKKIQIGSQILTETSPAMIIAELSANHNGNIKNALASIRAAKRAGADAVKLQTYTADTLTVNCENPDFKIKQGMVWDGKYLYQLYSEASTPLEWHKELFAAAEAEGLICFSTPFDFETADFLENLNVPAFKIASFEITDIPLIRHIAKKKKPVIISTGIAETSDIDLAVHTCRKSGNEQIVLLKCTSAYPSPINEMNLIMIKDLAERFNVLSGLSDHTISPSVPATAVVLGAKIIEKHFTIDKSIGGHDISFSLDEKEFTQMVTCIREAEMAIGRIDYTLTEKQVKSKELCRSLYIVRDVREGEIISNTNVRSIRPGYGLHPKYLDSIMGKQFAASAPKGTRVTPGIIREFQISKKN